jgi:predicted Zn finger-like uncharacterized protein
MKICCPGCAARFALDDKRVPDLGLSIKCPKCKQAFSVQRPRAGEEDKVVHGTPLTATGQLRVAVHDTLVDQTVVQHAPDAGAQS